MGIFGGIGCGKTSFLESCKNRFHGLKVREFQGISNQIDESNTLHSEGENVLSKRNPGFFDKLTLFDSEGMVNSIKALSQLIESSKEN